MTETERETAAGQKDPCPRCGSRDVAVISYGFVARGWPGSPEQLSGEYVLGGCVLRPEDRHCNKCQNEWRVGPPWPAQPAQPPEPPRPAPFDKTRS
jgi:hypothetical protein